MRTPSSPSPVRVLALAAALLATAACRSTSPVPEGVPLPFHVALVPTEIHDTTVLAASPAEPVYPHRPANAVSDDLHLDLDTTKVSRGLQRELARAFVRTTLLELPQDPGALLASSPLERERFWQERARAAGADLLVRTRLYLDPQVSHERNEKFWLNVPLWLMLGGPFSWFVDDTTYELGARLQAEVYDVSQEHDSLADYALLPIPLHAEFAGTDLTLIQRADGVEDYAFSILVPAGLLARRTEDIEAELEDLLPLELGRELARKTFAERAQFEQNLGLGAFRLAAQEARLERDGAGRVRVRVPVDELTAEESLHRYELRAGETVLASRSFPERAAGERRRVIEEVMDLPADAQYVTVRVVDAGLNVRSYTLRMPPPAESR